MAASRGNCTASPEAQQSPAQVPRPRVPEGDRQPGSTASRTSQARGSSGPVEQAPPAERLPERALTRA